MDDKTQYVEALCEEMAQRQSFFPSPTLASIYFGGGTPSLLSKEQLEVLFNTIHRYFKVNKEAEITIEANPDDLSESYLKSLIQLGFNRLSIGIQSFNDDDLKTIGRRHTAADAITAVKRAHQCGFHNISIDLIFGLPQQTPEKWKKNLELAFTLPIQHISSYNLIYEKGTPFYKKLQNGEFKELDDETNLLMYKMLINACKSHHFQHYETSNFALPNFHSQHNSHYWKGQPYLGLGAGAHSYNGNTRRWNVSNNARYIRGIKDNKAVFESEEITPTLAYNEYIMTGLRTMWGCDLEQLEIRFGSKMFNFCINAAQPFLTAQQLEIKDHILRITEDAIFISDNIMSELMWVD